jgi:creatinine amidohydrolase
VAWWNLLTTDKEFLPRWRQSKFPGGCSHACELETSLYLYLDSDNVRHDQIKSGTISFNDENNPFNWVDLFAAGPGALISWTSSYSETGVLGDAELATPEKGRQAFEESVKQLVRFVNYFKDRPVDQRRDRHRKPPTMPMPWGQHRSSLISRRIRRWLWRQIHRASRIERFALFIFKEV